MWSIRQRFRQSGPLLVFCSFLIATGFLLQLHTWYVNRQKFYRIEGYKSYMNELTGTMGDIQKVANRTSRLLNNLEKSLDVKKTNKENLQIS